MLETQLLIRPNPVRLKRKQRPKTDERTGSANHPNMRPHLQLWGRSLRSKAANYMPVRS